VRRGLWLRVALAGVVLWFGARAVSSIGRAPAHTLGRRAFAEGDHELAARLLPRAVGDGREAAELWYAAQSTLAVYHARRAVGAPDPEVDVLLGTAYRQFTEAISRSPASGWYWAGLAQVYHERERRSRALEGLPLEAFGDRPLASLGRDGRVALGALRLALGREPTNFVFHDQLALLFFDDRLDALALAAVRDAARVQPLWDQHTLAGLDPSPLGLLDAFAEGARSALGQTPLLHAVDHHIALGRIELARGRYSDALAELDRALESPRPALQEAEARYHRARALERLGRIDEARDDLARANREPVFRRSVLLDLARIDEAQGQPEAALGRLRELRQLDPADLHTLLELARLAARAGRTDEARQALSWAATRHPSSPGPILRLGDLSLSQGDLAEAQRALDRLSILAPNDPEVRRFARDLDAARRP
jgi:tetratricopeptide (TPR) repeat protein